jgi:hypothetical protein
MRKWSTPYPCRCKASESTFELKSVHFSNAPNSRDFEHTPVIPRPTPQYSTAAPSDPEIGVEQLFVAIRSTALFLVPTDGKPGCSITRRTEAPASSAAGPHPCHASLMYQSPLPIPHWYQPGRIPLSPHSMGWHAVLDSTTRRAMRRCALLPLSTAKVTQMRESPCAQDQATRAQLAHLHSAHREVT